MEVSGSVIQKTLARSMCYSSSGEAHSRLLAARRHHLARIEMKKEGVLTKAAE